MKVCGMKDESSSWSFCLFFQSMCMLLKMPSLPASGLWFCCIPSSYMGELKQLHGWFQKHVNFRLVDRDQAGRLNVWTEVSDVGTCWDMFDCEFMSFLLTRQVTSLYGTHLLYCPRTISLKPFVLATSTRPGEFVALRHLCHWHRFGEKTSPPKQVSSPNSSSYSLGGSRAAAATR